jgi:DNA-binding transcriptional MerR regulator
MGESAPMTTNTVARLLRRSADSVRRYEREGRLPAVRTESGIRLFDPIAVERLARELKLSEEQRSK